MASGLVRIRIVRRKRRIRIKTMSTKSVKGDTDVPKDRRGLLRSEDCIEARQISGDFDVYKICCSADMVAAKN